MLVMLVILKLLLLLLLPRGSLRRRKGRGGQ